MSNAPIWPHTCASYCLLTLRLPRWRHTLHTVERAAARGAAAGALRGARGDAARPCRARRDAGGDPHTPVRFLSSLALSQMQGELVATVCRLSLSLPCMPSRLLKDGMSTLRRVLLHRARCGRHWTQVPYRPRRLGQGPEQGHLQVVSAELVACTSVLPQATAVSASADAFALVAALSAGRAALAPGDAGAGARGGAAADTGEEGVSPRTLQQVSARRGPRPVAPWSRCTQTGCRAHSGHAEPVLHACK